MNDDPRKAKTLEDACANGDGTYNGARLLSWLSEALHPAVGISEGEVRKLWEQQKSTKAETVEINKRARQRYGWEP